MSRTYRHRHWPSIRGSAKKIVDADPHNSGYAHNGLWGCKCNPKARHSRAQNDPTCPVGGPYRYGPTWRAEYEAERQWETDNPRPVGGWHPWARPQSTKCSGVRKVCHDNANSWMRNKARENTQKLKGLSLEDLEDMEGASNDPEAMLWPEGREAWDWWSIS